MGHAVDLPHPVPQRIVQVQAAHAAENAGIGDIGIDLPVVLARRRHQGLDVGLLADVAAHGQTLDVAGHGLGALEVEVGHHHGACTVCRKALRNRTADPAGAAGHDGDFVPYVHEYLLLGNASVSPCAPLACHAGDTRALACVGLVSGNANKSYFKDFTVRPMTTSAAIRVHDMPHTWHWI